MIPICPPEIKKLEEIYGPYMEGCHLREDAPPEAKEAFNQKMAWLEKVFKEHGL